MGRGGGRGPGESPDRLEFEETQTAGWAEVYGIGCRLRFNRWDAIKTHGAAQRALTDERLPDSRWSLRCSVATGLLASVLWCVSSASLACDFSIGIPCPARS